MPLFSVIIPWCNRKELSETLKKNLPVFEKNEAEVIISNVGGDPIMLEEILQSIPYPVKTIRQPEITLFNKCLALNLGVLAATGTYLFLLDTDIILEEDLLPEAAALLENDCFLTIGKVYESEKSTTAARSFISELAYFIEVKDINNNKALIETSRHYINEKGRSAPGLVMLRKEHFMEVNGMNTALSGWGWEDNDLLCRLQLKLSLKWEKIGSAIHLTHTDQQRTINNNSRKTSEAANYAKCLDNYSQGNYAGTYKEDVQQYIY
ncbi:glycosyltransferase [Chitinophaga tropicalis]|uniref:Glycosyltransferase n=1 Tax=Chitinophaga tropicalis TaxID=2683588 RepID=A0A7K1UC88_9BACT|nr:galactosyltransferase-related protein [Chitinophaga tropicalis]MVT12001.1 glycosyltransferase [Chitinophaga tropicalis]